MTPQTETPAIARSHRPIQGGARVGPDSARRENLDTLRRLVMSRRSRLGRLIGMHAPDIVVRNEMRMLRAALEAMLEFGATVDVGARGEAGVWPDRRRSGRRGPPDGPLSEAGR